MDYQLDTRSQTQQTVMSKSGPVRVGQNDQEVVVFRNVNRFIYSLQGQVGGLDYQMKLAAPWNGFRYQLRQGDHELASAKKNVRMHAFEPDRPLIRHHRAEFQLDVSGRRLNLTPEDRHGLIYILEETGNESGRLAMRSSMRTFEVQKGDPWEADLTPPEGWSVPLAAFVAWLAREGRYLMSRDPAR